MDWTTQLPSLVTAAATLLGVATTMVFTNSRERRQFKQQRLLAGLQARRDAFVEFARAARLIVRHLRQRAWYYEISDMSPPGEGPVTEGLLASLDGLLADFATAHVAARLQASPEVRPALDRLYVAVTRFEDLIEITWFNQNYDSAQGSALLAEVETAEKLFLDACQTDIDFQEHDEEGRRLGRPKRREIPPAL
ncbi:hypothetical protein GCM10022226_74020 [Sphaerisporangium flaviroseum]|uniref:Uncharacterized protein n=1 Tax=Sphaerisporangium flaviroseum TaxID=509199 RepID=A0ABP7JBQ2_9ACTN